MYKKKSALLVIPCFNEEETIENTIKSIPDYIDKIVVIDDGSTDGSVEIAKSLGVEVISHKTNRGVGAAIRTGIKRALNSNVDIMVNMDADGQFDPEYISKLLDPIIDEGVDFVTASRFFDKKYYPRMSRIKFWGNKFMSFFVSKIIGKRYYDVSCGFRAYSREALLKINLFGEFTYTQETFIDLAFKNMVLMEVPIKVRGTRKYGKSKIASNLFIYGYRTLRIIVKTIRDYRPFMLFSFIGSLSFIIGLIFGLFLLIHYILTGFFTPHKWAGFLSGFMIFMGILFFLTGFILDMFTRMRINQEEILYYIKNKKNIGE